MEHWFDIITKLSSRDDRVTRRDVFKAVLAGVGMAPLLVGDEAARAAATPTPSARTSGGAPFQIRFGCSRLDN